MTSSAVPAQRQRAAPDPTAAGAPVLLACHPVRRLGAGLIGRELTTAPPPSAGPDLARPEEAADRVMRTALSQHRPTELLGGGERVVGLSRRLLSSGTSLPVEPGDAIIAAPSGTGIDALRTLHAQGHQLALDIRHPAGATELEDDALHLARWVVLDLAHARPDDVASALPRIRAAGVVPVARGAFDPASERHWTDLGFELVIGAPVTPRSQSPDLHPAQASALQLVAELSDPQASVDDIAATVKADAALGFELLRVANSAAYGYARTISAIRDAVVIVGLARLRAWVTLLALSPSGPPSQPMLDAVIGARMCELLATRLRLGPPGTAFVVAMLDGVGRALGLSTQQVLERLPQLSGEVMDALRGVDDTLHGALMATRAQLAQDPVAVLASGLPEGEVTRAYVDALSWSIHTATAAGDGGDDGDGDGDKGGDGVRAGRR